MIEALLAGFFGLLIGSFLNVCIYRIPRDLSVVWPRSFCPGCEKPVASYDNVPVLSYLLLGGRCRHCKQKIPLLYPFVELLTGLLFFWSIYSRGPNWLGVKLCLFSAILVVLMFTDIQDRILPDEFTIGGFFAALATAPFTPAPSSLSTLFAPISWPQWAHHLLEATIGGGFTALLLWVIAELYLRVRKREGLGLGDVKMMLTVGGFLGLPGALLTIFVGSVLGSVLGSLFIWFSKEDMDSYQLPFGAFLGAAALLVGLFGEHFFHWYWKLGAGC